MKVTTENINTINQKLKNYPVVYLDTRYELIDHFAEELEQLDGDFDTEFEPYFESKKPMLDQMLVLINKNNGVEGFRLFFKKLFSVPFLVVYLVMTSVLYQLTQTMGKDWLMGNFDVLPMILPAPISAVLLYQFLYKKQFVRRLVSVLFSINFLFMFYLMIGIQLVRKWDSLFGLLLFSFFMSASVYYWVVFFQLRKENQNYLKLI
ncbi:hypothetical protein LZZ90_02350 [Flavobacterium sp. SM15]|uniref:hypothetical protein n=1 Tax=Flavobacterium sp. SM15 TaxID=2908005 RepID=UPI001EDAAAE2|nr:hypothetical protein [Flavobacterium sp. SM15]MCG2610346.1 hypothetical protein [Flavobacterium sp. SM15]